jgi:hypothetical protein
MIGAEIGEPVEVVHELMKQEFLTWVAELINKDGVIMEMRKPLSLSLTPDDPEQETVNTMTMTVYIEKIRAWALDFLKINIPDPRPK